MSSNFFDEFVCLCTELSPEEYKEKHMVLTLNLIDTDHHKDYAVEILQQYGKVGRDV